MMTVQIIEIAGQKMAMLPIADYERLVNITEDKADTLAAIEAGHRRNEGEEYLPADMLDRMLNGESALKVWREYRGKRLKDLAEITGVAISYLSQIEHGHRRGKPALWRSLAKALDVSADDILPES